MDQKSIVLYFDLKGINAINIHKDLMATIKEDAMLYALVMRYLRSSNFSVSTDHEPEERLAPSVKQLNKIILLALGGELFASIRQLARATHLPPSTVYWRFMQNLGFTV
jgi:hypothetical protein